MTRLKLPCLGKKNMEIKWNKIDYENINTFRYRPIGNKYLLVNEIGGFVYLEKNDFRSFLDGKLEKESEPYKELATNNFLKNEQDWDAIIENYRSKAGYLLWGPSLHIVVVTLKCNHNCIYCHASAQDQHDNKFDMDKATADKTLDTIFDSTCPFAAIEFQGGEPLLNLPIVKYIIEESRKRNKKHNKELELRLVTNGSLLNDELFDYLLDNKVSLCLSFDGPKELHDKNRPYVGGSSYDNVIKWLKRFNEEYPKLQDKGYIWRIGTSLTVTRNTLSMYKELVDEYIEQGMNRIYLRYLNPFGFSQDSWLSISYGVEDFLEFYRNTMDYIIELNLKGTEMMERFSLVFLTKILSKYEPNHLDFRSPCGAGIGQMAYNYNGDVYTCDEGRMLSMMGDESFKLGNVNKNSYEDFVLSPVTRSLCTASCLDGLAGCADCIYKPYCGVCPLYNYFEQGSIFSQMTNSERCKLTMGTMDYLFEKLQDEKARGVLEKWVEKDVEKMQEQNHPDLFATDYPATC